MRTCFSLGRGQRGHGGRFRENEERGKWTVAIFYLNEFLFSKFRRASSQLFPRIGLLREPSLLYHYGRSTALPITGLRDGSLNRPECPLTCARSSSTIALSSSISSFSSTFSPCSFPFSSLSLEISTVEDLLGVFGDVLPGISFSFASMV